MSKRHVEELLAVLHHIFADVGAALPTLVAELSKDEQTLRCFVQNRGIHALCMDLPAAGKHLDRCLDSGQYIPCGLPFTRRVSSRVVIPKFLRGLHLLVFDEAGTLRRGVESAEAVYFLRQIYYVGKKAELAFNAEDVQREVGEFYCLDQTLPKPEGFWESEAPTRDQIAEHYTGFRRSELLLGRREGVESRDSIKSFLTYLDFVSSCVASGLGVYDPEDWRLRHGPGAISEVTGPTNKYSWRGWSDRLGCVFPISRFGYHNLNAWAGKAMEEAVCSDEGHSRLIAVPKSYRKPRLIAAEPCANQFCQQNVWHYLSTRVERCWIGRSVRFRDQSLNQTLCKRGSEDGSLATVDLSAASDRVTCHVVGQMFRDNPDLLLALQCTRTRFIHQKLHDGVPGRIKLNKFSTMGSACTFPVESLIFFAVATAAVLCSRQRPMTQGEVRRAASLVAVFGDDIVIPTDSRKLLYDALEVLFFKVNASKSFGEMNFRESCGVDSFRGVDVTPVYWKRPCSNAPETIASTVDVRNNFHRKFMLRTARYLESTVRGREIPYVSISSGVSGYKSFVEPPKPKIIRWNEELQRSEARITIASARVKRVPLTDDSAMFQYFTEAPAPHIHWEGGYTLRPTYRTVRGWVPLYDISHKYIV
jgi:hypothetical protein